MAARVYCAVLLCLAGCWSSTEAAPGLNNTAANPGVCPTRTNEPGDCALMRFEPCVDDRDCASNQKCCSNGCGLQCMAPVTVKPGVCLKTEALFPGCAGNVEKLCADDSECPKNEKCCGTPCGGTQCMAPVTDICKLPLDFGVCSAYNPVWGFDSAAGECVPFIFGGCGGNNNRFNSPEECEESCDVRNASCSLPMEVGPCKVFKPMWGFDPAAGKCVSFIYGGCEGNDNRFNSKKECEESCGVRKVNPGVCPRRKYKPAMCARVTFMPCVYDRDCAKNEKCCSNGCGLQCMAAITVPKAGVCPAKKYKPAMCARMRLVPCAVDRDCTDKQICCDNGCGFIGHCTTPVTVNPGVCPVRKPKPWMCPLMNFMSCVDDGDCANNEKCCNNGCGLDCMPPVTGPLSN